MRNSADIAKYTNNITDNGGSVANPFSHSAKLNWMGTFRGRAGIATGNSLFYATGGLAVADTDLKRATGRSRVDLSGVRVGWVAGLGTEYKVSERGSIKFELLHSNLGEVTETDCGGRACVSRGYNSNTTVTFGYTYQFGG